MKNLRRVVLVALLLALAVLVGRWSARWGGEVEHTEPLSVGDIPDEPTLWTCPMHAQIRLPDNVPCPLCGMDLVPLAVGGDDPRQLVMSASAKTLAGIETATVVRDHVTMPVRMTGKIDFDETAVRTISAWVSGRLDRLYVDYTGVRVEKGDHLVWLYSPDLLTAQEELLAAHARRQKEEPSEFLAQSNERAYQAARDKLRLLGLTEEQVEEIEARGSAEDHVMITSPAKGVVIRKHLDEGAHVQTGTPVYTIADLSHLWVRLDAYEQDLPWLRYGQKVRIEAEAVPGESFEGWVSFLDPMVDEGSRTIKLRVNLDNERGRLKPGMFVRAVVESRIGSKGHVLESGLAGKWVSPMHPEVVKDEPGPCDVCGMDLVPAEQLGLVSEPPVEKPLVVPASAVLVTGRRAVVYVEVPGKREPTYEGREVRLGPRAGDRTIIESGLEEGERVVTHGAFRIDSSMQIQAKASMMSMPEQATQLEGPEIEVFRESLRPLYAAYFALQTALAADDAPGALRSFVELREAFAVTDPRGLSMNARRSWSEQAPVLARVLEEEHEGSDIEALRESFKVLSDGILVVQREYGHIGGAPHFEVYCSMAFDDTGAAWLQDEERIANPYYGSSMLRCGSVEQQFDSAPEPTVAAEFPKGEE